MGTSKSYRSGPAAGARNTPGRDGPYNKGTKSTAEGTHVSGEGYGRKGSKAGGGKSESRKVESKTDGIYGQS